MALRHMLLIVKKAPNSCQPGHEAKGVVASAPPWPGLCPGAAQPKEAECRTTKPTHGDTPAEVPQAVTLE